MAIITWFLVHLFLCGFSLHSKCVFFSLLLFHFRSLFVISGRGWIAFRSHFYVLFSKPNGRSNVSEGKRISLKKSPKCARIARWILKFSKLNKMNWIHYYETWMQNMSTTYKQQKNGKINTKDIYKDDFKILKKMWNFN